MTPVTTMSLDCTPVIDPAVAEATTALFEDDDAAYVVALMFTNTWLTGKDNEKSAVVGSIVGTAVGTTVGTRVGVAVG